MTSDAQEQAAAGDKFDIDRQRLGSIYARALLGTTEPRQQSDAVVDELASLVENALNPHPELEATLASPRISPSEKAALLDRVFGGRVSDELLTFLKVVGQHGRLDCIREIQLAARHELNQLRQRVAVQVITAEPLNNQLKQRIVEQLQTKLGHEVDLECTVDTKLLGGLVIRIGDTVFDASVANQLAQVRAEAINKTSLTLRESVDRFAVSG